MICDKSDVFVHLNAHGWLLLAFPTPIKRIRGKRKGSDAPAVVGVLRWKGQEDMWKQ